MAESDAQKSQDGRSGPQADGPQKAALEPGKQTRVGAASASGPTSRDADGAAYSGKSPLGRYLDIHQVALRAALGEKLARLPWPDPAADLKFTRQGEDIFGAELVRRVGALVQDEGALRQLLFPHDLDGLLHQLVVIHKPAWSPMFGHGIAQFVERTAVSSYRQRIGPRIRALLSQSARTPTADEITPGHPMDPHVIAVLTKPSVLDFSDIAQTEKDQTTPKAMPIQARWLGRQHPLLWNCAQLAVRNVPREQIAAQLWKDPTKTTMAAMIQVWDDVVRVEPGYARSLLAEHYSDAFIGLTDPAASEQTHVLARSGVTRGDAPARQFEGRPAKSLDLDPQQVAKAKKVPKRPAKTDNAQQAEQQEEDEDQPVTAEQLLAVENDIGARLDEIRAMLRLVGISDGLTQVYSRRMERMARIATGDAATLERWKPVLQFQHAQLLAVKPQIAAVTKQLAPLVMQGPALQGRKRGERAYLERHLGRLVEAADVSELRDQSTYLVAQLASEAREAQLDQLDASQRQGEADVQDARSLKPTDPDSMTQRGTDEKREDVASRRREAISGQGEGASSTSQRRAIVTAGEYALHARINAARMRLDRLYETAIEVYGDPEKMRKVLPNVHAFPDLIALVHRYLAAVDHTWQAAFNAANRDGVKPGDDPDEWLWQAKATALTAAQEAFSNIALDRGIVDFIQAAAKNIQDRRVHNALVGFAATLLITVGASMAAAQLGTAVRGALAAEGATVLSRGIGLALDVGINVSINSAVQYAMSGGQESFGLMFLENALMDLFTRGLLAPLHRAEAAAKNLAGQYARLPHLSAGERNALMALHTGARNSIGEMVGGMAAQWAAHRLVKLYREKVLGEDANAEISEPFAATVLQQGAAIGLGKYFGGKLHAWQTTRDLLAGSRMGNDPSLHSYIAARDEFFQLADQLANNLSPDPAAESQLLALHDALNLQEQTLFASHGTERSEVSGEAPSTARTAPRADSAEASTPRTKDAPAQPDSSQGTQPTGRGAGTSEIAHKGIMFANSVGSTAYLRDGFFRVDTPTGHVLVEVVRSSGSEPRVRRKGDHATLEVPRGLTEVELERAVVGKLTEIQQQELRRSNGEKASAESGLGDNGTGERLSPEDMGRVAELRVLKERAAEQDARGPSGQEQGAAFRAEITKLEKQLGLAGDTPEAQKRRHVVEVQQVVLSDTTRRARVAAELDGTRGHPGVELHNHFNGVVKAEVFRQRAATAAGGKDTGSWIPLLERIAGFKGKDFEHQMDGDKITRRATSGDAVRIASESQRQVGELLRRANDPKTTPDERAAYVRAAEAVAEEASQVALAASPETEFNSAYEVRDQLVKETFGGPAKEGETSAAAKQRAYDDYIREAILQLAADGVGYSEQSISVKKLAGVMHPDRIAAAIEQLIAEGRIRPGEIDVRILTMLHTSQFGERAPDMPPVETPQRSDSALRRDVKTSKQQEGHPDVVGRDVGGPEQLHFDERGADAFENIYYQDLAEANRTGTPRVERPHVGEGVVDPETGKPYHTDKDRVIKDGEPAHYERSRRNIDVMLGALERIKAKGKLDPTKVIVRFGHVTHATPEQAIRMRELGVVAEINLGSNVISGAVSQTEGVHGKRAASERLDDHSFPTLLFYDTQIVLNTDAGGVMSTSMRAEYQRARQTIEEVLSGGRTVRVRAEDARGRGREVPGRMDIRELSINDMTSAERDRFLHGYEKLYADAEAYYLRRPKPRGSTANPTTAASPFGGAHHTSIASDHGLIPGRGTSLLEGSTSDVKAAASAYRGKGYQVLETELAGGVVSVSVTSSDGEFHTTLRSWSGDAPSYIPVNDYGPLDRQRNKTGDEVRDWYHAQLARIDALNASWSGSGVPLSERARRAYEIRRHARLAAREQMQSVGGVESLSVRDMNKHGTPDGPSFEQLVERQLAKGKTLDQAYESIIASSKRSDEGYDARYGGKGHKQ